MIAIITGASSGIGREFAYQIDKENYEEIWLIARRTDRLRGLRNNLKTPSKILALDLLDDKSFEILSEELNKSNKDIGLLVNSAGVGDNDYFNDQSMESIEKTIKLNMTAPTKLIKIALSFMARGSTIINVASVAGFTPQPKFAQYAASKSYVISLSRALNREFASKDIHVSALCPNPVNTEFGPHHKSGIKKYATEDIHILVAKALKKAPYKDLITVHPSAKLMKIVGKILPHSFIMWLEKIFNMY